MFRVRSTYHYVDPAFPDGCLLPARSILLSSCWFSFFVCLPISFVFTENISGLQIVGVTCYDEPKEISNFQTRASISYPLINDLDNTLARFLGAFLVRVRV